MSTTDDGHTEFLIQHLPLADVLAFAVERDEVRRIAVPLEERAQLDGAAHERPTMRVIPEETGYVAEFAREARPLVVEVEEMAKPSAVLARLDAERNATPLTEIVGVYPEGKANWYHNVKALLLRPRTGS